MLVGISGRDGGSLDGEDGESEITPKSHHRAGPEKMSLLPLLEANAVAHGSCHHAHIHHPQFSMFQASILESGQQVG